MISNKSLQVNSTILLGDVIDVVSRIDTREKFDIIIADPPYNIGKDFGNNNDAMDIKDYLHWVKQWIKLSMNLLDNNGLMYIYGFPEILARIASLFPLEKQRILTWHYTNKTTPSSKFWQRSYESILCLWHNEKPSLQIDSIREPYSNSYVKCAGKTRKETQGRFGNKQTCYNVHPKGALPRDVIKIPALAGGAGNKERFFLCKTCHNNIYNSQEIKQHNKHDIIVHPTQKPIMLAKKLIQSIIVNNKGKVLIPFAGSGSECIAATQLNIPFLAVEINPDYVTYANKLIQKYNEELIA